MYEINTTNNIKLIAFDLFGVIFSEGHLISNVLMQLLPVNCDKSLVKSLYENFNTGNISEAEFWHPLGFTDYKIIRQTFLQSFKLDKDLQSVVNKLKPVYQLSILSNLPPDWADSLLELHQFEQTFSPQIFSGHVECKKPQPEIYRILQAQSVISAEHIVFIDAFIRRFNCACR